MTSTTGESISTLQLASRYHVERTWRQLRNGGNAARAARCSDDGQIRVGLGLESRQLVQTRGDLVQDEKGDRRGNANIADETTDRIEQSGRP